MWLDGSEPQLSDFPDDSAGISQGFMALAGLVMASAPQVALCLSGHILKAADVPPGLEAKPADGVAS